MLKYINKYIIFFIIICFRIIDLYTTKLAAVIDFSKQEQNLLVKIFNLDMKSFFILELILAIILGAIYLYYENNKDLFKLNKTNFTSYIKYYFFRKDYVTWSDWLIKFNGKSILVLFGSIIPIFLITTSILYSLNNYWVHLNNKGNFNAIKYYVKFSKFYFFDILIFVVPPLFLFFLLYKKLKNQYLINKLK